MLWVTGASEINCEGLYTLSKKEKRNGSISQIKKTQKSVQKSFKFSFNAVTLKKSLIYLSQFRNKVLNATEYRGNIFVAYGAIICLVWRSQWGFTVSRPTAWQFITVSRQKMLYSTVNRQKCSLRLTVKKFLGVSNLTISADLDGIPAPKEFPNWKNRSLAKKHSF